VPTATRADGVTLYYELAGEGETVAFVGEAGYGAWQWGWQHARVAGPYRALVWDLRGTGRSTAPSGPYDVEALADDFDAVLRASDSSRAHLVGCGLGGMVALEYARQYDRAETLTLLGTAPDGDDVDEDALRELYAPPDDETRFRTSLEGAFSDRFRADRPDVVDRICAWRADEDAPPAAFAAQVAATCDFESEPLYEVTSPALVCHGLADPVVAPEVGRELAADLPRGTFETIEGRHLCHVEHSRAVTDRLLDFLDEHGRGHDRN